VLLLSGSFRSPAAQQTSDSTIQRYSREAKNALAKDDLGAAAQALERLSRLTPDVAEVYGNLGMVYYAQGRYHQAAGAFEQAFKLNPNLPNARLMMGICYAQTGRAEKALPILEPAFRRPPGNEIGRVTGWQLQRAYVALGQPAKAVEVVQEMLRRYPDDPETLYDATHLYGDRALQTMMRLAEVAPDSAWTYFAIGEAFDSQMRYDFAALEYRLAIKADARLPGVHFRLGRALLHTLKNEKTTQEEALEAFQQEVALDQENSDAWYEIGEIHRKRGQLDRALQAFQKAVEYHPEFEEAHIGLARTLIDLNRPQGNTANYQKEIGLFRKYRERPPAATVTKESPLPSTFSAQEVTKQTLDPDSPNGP
jgi:tetratricopeptide (TPR) repeat protein